MTKIFRKLSYTYQACMLLIASLRLHATMQAYFLSLIFLLFLSLNLSNLATRLSNNISNRKIFEYEHYAVDRPHFFSGEKLTLRGFAFLNFKTNPAKINITSISHTVKLANSSSFLGVVFRRNGQNYYMFRFSANRHLPSVFLKFKNNAVVKKVQVLPKVLSAKKSHKFKILLSNDGVLVYLSDKLIGKFYDGEYKQGTVAFISGSQSVSIDNLSVRGNYVNLSDKQFAYFDDFSAKVIRGKYFWRHYFPLFFLIFTFASGSIILFLIISCKTSHSEICSAILRNKYPIFIYITPGIFYGIPIIISLTMLIACGVIYIKKIYKYYAAHKFILPITDKPAVSNKDKKLLLVFICLFTGTLSANYFIKKISDRQIIEFKNKTETLLISNKQFHGLNINSKKAIRLLRHQEVSTLRLSGNVGTPVCRDCDADRSPCRKNCNYRISSDIPVLVSKPVHKNCYISFQIMSKKEQIIEFNFLNTYAFLYSENKKIPSQVLQFDRTSNTVRLKKTAEIDDRTQNTEHRTQNTESVSSGQWTVDAKTQRHVVRVFRPVLAKAQKHKGTVELANGEWRMANRNPNNQQPTTNNHLHPSSLIHSPNCQITKLSNYQITKLPSAFSLQSQPPLATHHSPLIKRWRNVEIAIINNSIYIFIDNKIGKAALCRYRGTSYYLLNYGSDTSIRALTLNFLKFLYPKISIRLQGRVIAPAGLHIKSLSEGEVRIKNLKILPLTPSIAMKFFYFLMFLTKVFYIFSLILIVLWVLSYILTISFILPFINTFKLLLKIHILEFIFIFFCLVSTFYFYQTTDNFTVEMIFILLGVCVLLISLFLTSTVVFINNVGSDYHRSAYGRLVSRPYGLTQHKKIFATGAIEYYNRRRKAKFFLFVYFIAFIEIFGFAFSGLHESLRTEWYDGIKASNYFWYFDPALRHLNNYFTDYSFRGRKFIHTKGNKKRIVILGGSTAWGEKFPVGSKIVYSEQLQERINKYLSKKRKVQNQGTKAQRHLSAPQTRQASKGTEDCSVQASACNGADCGLRTAECRDRTPCLSKSEIQNPKSPNHQITKSSIEVINAAFAGATTFAGYQFYKGVVSKYKPDILLFHFTGTDLGFERGSFKQYDTILHSQINHRQTILKSLIESSFTYLLARRIYRLTGIRHILYMLFSPKQQRIQENVEELYKLCKKNNTKLILVVSMGPNVYERSKTDRFLQLRIEKQLSKKFHLLLIDTLHYFEKRKDEILFIDEAHFSERGHELMADLIFNALKSKNLL